MDIVDTERFAPSRTTSRDPLFAENCALRIDHDFPRLECALKVKGRLWARRNDRSKQAGLSARAGGVDRNRFGEIIGHVILF